MKNIRLAAISLMLGGMLLSGSNLIAQDAKIKSVEFKELERSETAEPEADLSLMKKELKEYDNKGRMVNYVLHTANPVGQIVKSSEIKKSFEGKALRVEERMKYDEMGDLLLEEKIFFYDDKAIEKVEYVDHLKDPNQRLTKEYAYDSRSGNVSKITLYDNNGKKIGLEVWKYNGDNEEVKYKKWEKLPSGSKYKELKVTKYNKENGALAEVVKKVDDGKDKYEEVTTFQRNKIKEQLKYKNGELISQFGGGRSTFDPSKAKVLVDFGNDGGGFGMWANEDEYDDNGNKIKTTQTVDGEVTQVTTYKYDDRNNLTKVKKTNFEEGKETTTEEEVQEFDANNNMLRKAVYNNGILISEKKYDYQYY
jgi:hypothetical protein